MILSWIMAGISVTAAQAQTLTVNTPLSFGRMVMHDNSTQRDLRLLPNGSYVAGTGYYIIDTPPQLGSYTIQGQVPGRIMDISFIAVGSLNPGGAGPYFTLVDFFTVPSVVTTNGAGEATFQVGATLRSSGFMGNYIDSTYNGNFTISVTPQP